MQGQNVTKYLCLSFYLKMNKNQIGLKNKVIAGANNNKF